MNVLRRPPLACVGLVAALLLVVGCATRGGSCPGPGSAGVPRPAAPSAKAPLVAAPRVAPAAADSGAPWTLATPLGDVVAQRPETARLLEKAGLDYCCGGRATLGEAARAQGVDAEVLLAELLAVRAAPSTSSVRLWNDAPLDDLIQHIESTHHVFLRDELPRLTAIVRKVFEVHGEAHAELAEVLAVYEDLAEELPPHLALEEETLFPSLRALEGGDASAAPAVRASLTTMRLQHDGAGTALHRLRELTKGFAVPEDACALYRQMLLGLRELEDDLHQHVHLENNVLLPRGLALTNR